MSNTLARDDLSPDIIEREDSFNSCIDISISSKQEMEILSKMMQTPFEDDGKIESP